MKSVPAEKLEHIVECGWHRPSGLQPFELFVVSNADIGRPKMIRFVNLKKVRRSRDNFVTEVKRIGHYPLYAVMSFTSDLKAERLPQEAEVGTAVALRKQSLR
jgi:hypothetical protein